MWNYRLAVMSSGHDICSLFFEYYYNVTVYVCTLPHLETKWLDQFNLAPLSFIYPMDAVCIHT